MNKYKEVFVLSEGNTITNYIDTDEEFKEFSNNFLNTMDKTISEKKTIHIIGNERSHFIDTKNLIYIVLEIVEEHSK